MPITLAGDLITLEYIAGDATGDSWNNPFTIGDMAAAIGSILVAGSIYTFPSIRFIVKGSYTYLWLEKCIINFSGAFSNTALITITSGGNIRTGRKTGNSYINGVVIYTRDCLTLNRSVFINEMYDTVIISNPYANSTLAGVNASIVEGCKIMGIGTCNFLNSSAKIKYTTFTNCYYGSRQDTLTSFSFDDGIINGSNYGLLIRATGMTFTNIIFQACSTALRNNAFDNTSVETTTIGCTFDGTVSNAVKGTTTLETIAILNIKEWLNFTVKGVDGLPLLGASVKFYNQYNDLIINEITDANGKITSTSIMRVRYYAIKSPPDFVQITDNRTYSPYRIIISNAGYDDIVMENITIVESEELGIVAQFAYPELLISAVDITDCTKIGINDGKLVITAEGGDATYTYSINGTDYQASDTFSGLSAGDYTVYVKDGEDTMVSFDVVVGEPIPEEYVFVDEVITCDITEDELVCEIEEDVIEGYLIDEEI